MFGTHGFAQFNAGVDFPVIVAIIAGLILLVILNFLVLILKYYKRCPSNRILVIYGKTGSGQAAECVHGGARLVMPLIQDYAWLSLEPIRIEIPQRPVIDGDKVGIRVPQFYSVAIGTTTPLMQNAAIRLLGVPFEAIRQQVEDIIVSQLDQLIDSIQTGRVKTDQDSFTNVLQDALRPELEQLGLVLITVRYE